MRVQTTIPDKLLKEIDDFYPGNYTNRTAFLIEAVREKLEREKTKV